MWKSIKLQLFILKKKLGKANERTKSENDKVKEPNEELTKLKEKVNQGIIENENHRKLIDELIEKVRAKDVPTDNNTQESEEMRKLKEKAKEFRAMSDLMISKLKEKYLEEINDVKIKKLRVEGELNSVVKERHRLKESERILVETFATLKTFYEKPIDCRKLF